MSYTKIATKRITRELKELYENPLPGVVINVDESDIGKVQLMIMGPEDTPYECGFFYFLLKFPTDYPARPPAAQFMTTDGGRVRFNPNLYKCGKVCLSILGTWSGPSWTPALSLSSIILALQAQIMVENPIVNEPGYGRSDATKKKNYNDFIVHETMRVAVCNFLEGSFSGAPPEFVDFARRVFIEKKIYRKAIAICKKYQELDGKKSTAIMQPNIVFNFSESLKRIERLKVVGKMGKLKV